MNDVLIATLSQWGAAGIVLIAAGYIIYDSWKKNKANEKWFREHMIKTTPCPDHQNQLKNSLDGISDKLNHISQDNQQFREEISNRVNHIEETIQKLHPSKHQHEAIRIQAVTQVAPAINGVLADGLKLCKIDHIALGLLHNGSTTLSGIPYIKMDIVAEKYKPIQNPNDVSIIPLYQSEDIIQHNRLPQCILQSKSVELDIENSAQVLMDMDFILYNRCLQRGIKRIAFIPINDHHGLCNGCLIAYKFTNEPMDINLLESKANIIRNLYCSMLETLGDTRI